MISKQFSASLLKALQAQGTNILVANGAAAGQKAQHFMIHVIPRMEKDGIGLDIKGKKATDKELEELRKLLVSKVNKDFVEEEVPEEKKEDEEPKPPKENKKTSEVAETPQKVVEAEFEEPKKPAKKTKEKKTPKKTEKEKPEPKEDISLDDIANLITGS